MVSTHNFPRTRWPTSHFERFEVETDEQNRIFFIVEQTDKNEEYILINENLF